MRFSASIFYVQVDTLKFERDTGVQADTLTHSAASMPDSGVSMTSSSAAVQGLSPASTDVLRGFTPSSERAASAASAASSTNLMARKVDDYDMEGDVEEEDLDDEDEEVDEGRRDNLLEKFAAEYIEEEKRREERKRRRKKMEAAADDTITLNYEEELNVEEQLDKLMSVLRNHLDELHRLLEEEADQESSPSSSSQDLVSEKKTQTKLSNALGGGVNEADLFFPQPFFTPYSRTKVK